MREVVQRAAVATLDQYPHLNRVRRQIMARSEIFPPTPEELVQTDLRGFKTPWNSWEDACDRAFEAVSDGGGVLCAPELGKVDTIRRIDVPERRFLYTPTVYGIHSSPATGGGPGFSIRPIAAMDYAVKLNGQGAGASGISIIEESQFLTAAAIGNFGTLGGNVGEVWLFGVATRTQAATPFGIDLRYAYRSGLSHFNASGGDIGVAVGTDSLVGFGRMRDVDLAGLQLIGGSTVVMEIHPVSGEVNVQIPGNDNVLMGVYPDSPTKHYFEFDGGSRNKIVGVRGLNNSIPSGTRYMAHYDSTDDDCEGNLIDDFHATKGSGNPDWDFFAKFTTVNVNGDHKLGIIGAKDALDLCAEADRFRFVHVGMVELQGGIMRNNGTIPLTDAATVAVNCDHGDVFTLATTTNRTIGNPTKARVGRRITFVFTDTGGGVTHTFAGNYELEGGVATFAIASGLRRAIEFLYVATDVWVEVGRTADLS